MRPPLFVIEVTQIVRDERVQPSRTARGTSNGPVRIEECNSPANASRHARAAGSYAPAAAIAARGARKPKPGAVAGLW
jgi:hypothetical protein